MRKLILIGAVAVVAVACGTGADMIGEIIEDAGVMLQDGSVPDAGAQGTPAQCNKSEVDTSNPDFTITRHWAEFSVTPGVTEVTTCQRYDAEDAPPYTDGVFCWRGKAGWKEGTTTGFMQCGVDYDYADPDIADTVYQNLVSITVHN